MTTGSSSRDYPPPPHDYDRRGAAAPSHGHQRGGSRGGPSSRGGGGGGGYHPNHRGMNHPNHPYGGPPPRRGAPPAPPPPPPPPAASIASSGGGGGNAPPRRRRADIITFRSYEEEQDWVEERRRKRLARGTSKWDVLPTVEQLQQTALAVAAMLPLATAVPVTTSTTPTGIQQTRHARRLYVGNLPDGITEAIIEQAFYHAIQVAWDEPVPLDDNPILNVYINHERRFCFVEFKTVEMTTACINLDGLVVQGQTVKIKRPNDYNALTAPKLHPSQIPQLHVSRLGIISNTVPDGPNKIFIGGLHYHLQDPQVLELLSAFGKIKAFHLVKNEGELNSKGYCFVEYADPAITHLAVQGLNGMDIGGGKSLTARLAGDRSGATTAAGGGPLLSALAPPPPPPPLIPLPLQPRGDRTIIMGFDVEELVDAATGLCEMPVVPKYFDPLTGQPLTRIVPFIPPPPPPPPPPPRPTTSMPPQQYQPSANQGGETLGSDGSGITYPTDITHPTQTGSEATTPILVLHNMVTEEDLETEDSYQGLKDEVAEECRKYGQLIQIVIPRDAPHRRIYLQYATVSDAEAARKELQGRKFGDAMVQTSFLSELDFRLGRWN